MLVDIFIVVSVKSGFKNTEKHGLLFVKNSIGSNVLDRLHYNFVADLQLVYCINVHIKKVRIQFNARVS